MSLPEGWERAALGEFCNVTMGQSPPGSTYNSTGTGLPFYQGKAEFGGLYPTPSKWCSAPTKVAEAEDVLISVRAPVGPTNLCPASSCIGRGLAGITPLGGIPSRYVLYALRRVEPEVAQLGTGSTFKAISGETLRRLSLPIAPLGEQCRVVAAIEEHLSRLDSAVAGLKRVHVLIPRYRAAVLKAAVDGRLGREGAFPNTGGGKPTAREWLSSLANPGVMIDKGATGGWARVSVLDLATSAGYGSSEKCEYQAAGPPVLRIPNVDRGGIDLQDLKRARRCDGWDPDDAVAPGDLLVIRTNGSRGLIGRAALVTEPLEAPHHFASYLIRLRLLPDPVLWRWISLWWDSPPARNALTAMAATSAGQYNISLGKLKQLFIDVPPRGEAGRTAAEVERRLSVADSVERQVEAELVRAGRLRQSILKRAFDGKLVPQHPNDEPAGMLLERIRASHAASPTRSRRARRPA